MQFKGLFVALTLACVGSHPIAIAQDKDLQSEREWIVIQPQDFSNEVLFERRGQAIVRSSRYEARGAPFGDFDGDFDIDQHDYYAMQVCLSFSGPGITVPPACLVFDRDVDGDVDLIDAAEFQTVFTGTVVGVFVEAGELVPVIASPNGYYSGVPGAWGNNALNGLARQGGYAQDDFWYQWTLIAKPENAGSVVISNLAAATTAYTVLPPLRSGDYVFQLKVTNLVTIEYGIDTVALALTVAGDIDSDGVADPDDNCPTVSNPDQANSDGDACGDACEGDCGG